MQSKVYDQFSHDFFKEGIVNYTKKTFDEYTKCIDTVYSPSFEQKFIREVFFEKIEMIKSIIETNRLSKLWLVYAETLQSEANRLNDLFKKEINSKTSLTTLGGYKDKDMANINLVKSQLTSLIITVCIKVNINKDDLSLLRDSKVKVIELFNWLNTFAQYKSLPEEREMFIKEIILKLPSLVTTESTPMNPFQLKWLGEIFIALGIAKEWYEKELNELIEEQEKKRSFFGKLMQAAKEAQKLSRSRRQSYDKTDLGPKEKNDGKAKDNKIYCYFKPLAKQTAPKKEEHNSATAEKDKAKDKEKVVNDLKGLLNNFNAPLQSQNSFTFGEESNVNDPLLMNTTNEDAYSRYSESNYSKKDYQLNHYHFNTSFSNLKLYRNYSNISSSALSVNSLNAYSNPIPGLYDTNAYSHKSSGGGINSLLKSKMKSYLNLPTIHKAKHLSRSRDKEYSLQKKLTNRIINDENYNSQNIPLAPAPKQDAKYVDFKNLITRNFYQINNAEEENKSSPVFTKTRNPEENSLSTQTKTKQATLSKGKKLTKEEEDEILVYRTPNKITFLPRKDSISPGTTKKNLLLLFQQVNK